MGIKNFQGARKHQTTESNSTLLKVSDYMTKSLITFKETQSVEDVMQTLVDKRISGGPVVNNSKALIGMISETDCMKQISESRYYNMPMENQTIEKYVCKNVDTIDGNMNIFDAATKFIETKRRRFPVLIDGVLVGQISQSDVLKAALMFNGQNW